jgi:hypothetical protein
MLVVPAVTNFRKQLRGKVVLQNLVVHRRFHGYSYQVWWIIPIHPSN